MKTINEQAQELVAQMKEAAQTNLLYAKENVDVSITFKNVSKDVLVEVSKIFDSTVHEPSSSFFNKYWTATKIENISVCAQTKEYVVEKTFVEQN